MARQLKGSCKQCGASIRVKDKFCSPDCAKLYTFLTKRQKFKDRISCSGRFEIIFHPLCGIQTRGSGPTPILDFITSLVSRLYSIHSQQIITYVHPLDCEMFVYGIINLLWPILHSQLTIQDTCQIIDKCYYRTVFSADHKIIDKLLAYFLVEFVYDHIYGNRYLCFNTGKHPIIELQPVLQNPGREPRWFSSQDKREFTQHTGQCCFECQVPIDCELVGVKLKAGDSAYFTDSSKLNSSEKFYFHTFNHPRSTGIYDSVTTHPVNYFPYDATHIDISGNWIDDELAKYALEKAFWNCPPCSGSIPLRWAVAVNGKPIPWRGKMENLIDQYFELLEHGLPEPTEVLDGV